ncbi:MAG TPA: nucleoside-diphosphate kinase [Planctomycetota bacterium]|jgi:nucleoside-diphosphate kinase|nr:nucleoside-diphosphate kinase [Planctomycetota bacterium]
MERTFCMIKPDGVQRRLVGRILSRFEDKGLRIAGLKLLRMSAEQAERLYAIHKGKPFYDSLVRFVTSSPVVVMVIEGHQAVAVVRKLLGATFGFNAEPGTIRGDYGGSKGFNLIHGSDAVESAQREIPVFFQESELVRYEHADHVWVLEEPERK